MGLLKYLFRNSYESEYREVSVEELGQEYANVQLRKLALATCVNMTANALSHAVFRVYKNGQEVQDDNFYTLNVRPNPNQSAADFWRCVVQRMMMDGEALVVSRRVAGRESLWLADAFSREYDSNPFAKNRWQVSGINGTAWDNVCADDSVLHFVQGAQDPNKALAAVTVAQNRLIEKMKKDLSWRLGKHYKVKLGRTAQGTDRAEETFGRIMQKRVKPFFNSDNAVLPEYEGQEYTDMGTDGRSGNRVGEYGRELRKMADDIFDFTARAFLIPPVLISGDVADSKDAFARWLTVAIDPLAETIADEINHKSFGESGYLAGNFVRVDTSGLQHFDIFANADHIAKLVGSGWSYNDIQRAVGGAIVPEPWADEHYFTKNNAGVSALKGGEKNE